MALGRLARGRYRLKLLVNGRVDRNGPVPASASRLEAAWLPSDT